MVIVLGWILLFAWLTWRGWRGEERRRNAATRLVEGIGESRGPRPNLDDIPEALRCVVCLGAEREVFNTIFLCCKKHGINAIPCFLQLSDSRGGSARLWTCVHMR